MDEDGVRNVNVAPASLFELQAEIDIVEGNCKVCFVEAADRFELLLLDHQAGRRYCADILRNVRLAEISGLRRRKEAVSMAGGFADTYHDPGVLNGAVLVKELRAGGADLVPDRVAHQLGKPLSVH